MERMPPTEVWAPVADDQMMAPPWKFWYTPPSRSPGTSSVTGYPRRPFSYSIPLARVPAKGPFLPCFYLGSLRSALPVLSSWVS